MAFLTAQWIIVLVLGINFALIHGRNFMNVGVHYTITLAMYSGNQDPEWNIDSTHPMYNEVAWAVNRRPPTRMPTGLGYRGWNVQATNMFGHRAYKTVGRHTNRQLEILLLQSFPSQYGLSASLMNHVTSRINGYYPSAPAINTAKYYITKSRFVLNQRRAGAQCSTVFEPANWNYVPVQTSNNCYNYATNIQTHTFAKPGRGSGLPYTVNSAADVYAAAVRDGLTPLLAPDAGDRCLVALFIWPGQDYHFYRLDNNGFWSHKSGRTPARNTDESLNTITDPRIANRGPYSVFAGWMGVGPGITIS